MLGRPKIHRWFIEPRNAYTNEVLARSQEFLSDEQVMNGVACADGQKHKMWACNDYAFVASFTQCKIFPPLVFRVWHQEGNGQIRLWDFPKKKTRKILVVKK